MKVNNPVDCQSFFADQIKHNQEGLWCVALQPNGQILSLIEAKLSSKTKISCSLNTLKKLLEDKRAKQLLLVHIDPQNPFFQKQDWDWLELFIKFIEPKEIELCDYLKVSTGRYCSLINHEF